MQLPSSDLRSVHLDAVDCCALWHAVTRHSKLAGRWGVFGGKFKLIQSVFLTSLSLSFVPTDEASAMYRSFAKAELARLTATSRDGLHCRHSKQQHIDALKSILTRLPEIVTH